MCPFCYLGDELLQRALRQFPDAESVDVRYHSYQLMPDLTTDQPVDIPTLLSQKRGIDPEQAITMNEQLAARGREIGLHYRFDLAQAVSTRAAHEFIQFAADHGKQHEAVQTLFRAYFTDGLNVADHRVLADIATEIGISPEDALAALESGEYSAAVDADIHHAQELGISGVPFFVFGGKCAVSGAQPEEVFLQALATASG